MSSLKQIAADLGVSHALVSRVLNNRMGTSRVSEKTRQAILRHAKELDYQPNPLAIALKKGRKGVVGVFLHSVGVEGSDLSTDFIKAVSASLSDAGINLWLQFFENAQEFHKACNSKLLRRVDGLIVAGISHQELFQRLADLVKNDLKVATACFQVGKNFSVPNFVVDQLAQCRLTTQHLLEIGCRRIAHFHLSPHRYNGYLQAHTAARLTPDKKLMIPSDDYTSDAGRECMEKLLASGVQFDGICAESDAQAVGALQHLLDIGMPKSKWPKITGVDNSPIASEYGPIPITSVTAEMATCARMAVEAILQQMEGKPVESCQIPPRLVIRQSTVSQ
ncbi:MAG: LacI family DNA-binding transcriptional regulator [Chthoniobacterales bacterium]